MALAAVALWTIVRLSGHAVPRSREVWLAFLGMGVLNNVIPFSLIVWSQQTLPSGLAAILNATTPLWGVLVAHVATREEHATPARLGGAMLGFLGVAVMSGVDLLRGTTGALPATAAMLLATFSYACAGVFGRRLGRLGVVPMQAALGQLTAAALVMVPLALTLRRTTPS